MITTVMDETNDLSGPKRIVQIIKLIKGENIIHCGERQTKL